MFIKKQMMAAMIKAAYKKDTLRIRTTPDSYLFGSVFWIVRIDKEMLPNDIKGELVKCCGELPAVGEQYLVLKEGNQHEIPDIMIRQDDNIAYYTKTEMTLPERRLYQEPMTGKIAAAPIWIADNIGTEFTNDSETGVEDPEVAGNYFTWSNSCMELQAIRYDLADWKTVIKHMEGVRIVKEKEA